MKNKLPLKSAFVALFAAIICVGCFMRIPVGSVPIVFQNALCILCAVLIGGWLGCVPAAVFLLAGLIGLPVYSGGTSGIGVWAGPTGGFLPGYLIGALLAGLIAGKPSVAEKKFSWKVFVKLVAAIFAGMIILYVPGVIHFARWAVKAGKVPAEKTALAYTMGACVLPFLPGDLLKIIVSIPVVLKVRPVLARYIFDSSKKADKVVSAKEINNESTESK